MSGTKENGGEEEGGVWFYGPYDRDQTAHLKLRNGAHRPVIFRLKCNRPLQFNIKPSGMGVLQPNEFQILELTALPRSNEKGACVFLLELATVNERKRQGQPQTPIDPVSILNQGLGNMKKTAIPAYFGADATGDDGEETVVVLISETMMRASSAPMQRMFQRVDRRYPGAKSEFILLLALLAVICFFVGYALGTRFSENGEAQKGTK